MFRRSRFSIRPNVGPAGRAAATPQEAPSTHQEASETPKDASESGTSTDVTDANSVVTPSEKPTSSGDGNDQNVEGATSSAAVQRRKRFSVKPKVAPGRPAIATRTPKSPIKAVSEAPVDALDSDHDKTAKSIQTVTAAAPPGLQSPKRRRPSGESRQPKQPASSDSPQPSSAPIAEEPAEQADLPTDSGKQLESSQVKEVPPKPPDKIHPSIPDKEAVEISEKAKTLVSTKTGLSLSPSALSLSRLLNDPSDLQRLAKAQKLRELLRQERHKEKKLKKSKMRLKEYTLDPAKMTMRDLIRYLPQSNPMSSSLEETEDNETIVPPSPAAEESPERAQEPEVVPAAATPRPEEEEEAEGEAGAEAGEEDEDALMVPQVKVAEDGTLIIDEESLTVEVQRAKGPNPAQERDPIFERGSTTTYSSFRKGSYSKPWSSEETDMFFLAVSMVGTDFSMICQLFPHRARSEIKNKFKKEERENSWRIDKAFRERRKLDIEYFSKLLEKVLEVQKNKKKLKSLAAKNSPKKRSRKKKSKSLKEEDGEEEEEEEEDDDEEDQLPDLEDEEEGEKENEDLCNDGAAAASKTKRQRKRKTKRAAMDGEPKEKKKKSSEKGEKQAHVPEDTEAALPDDNTGSDVSKKTEENANASKDAGIKPAKLSRGRAPKPLLPLGKKWSKKLPAASTKDKAADKGDETVSEQVSNEQVNEESVDKKSADQDVSSEEEDATVRPPRPTRYGRVPKPTNPLIYAAKEHDAAPASPPSSAASAAKPKAKSAAKRGRSSKQQSAQESKKPKLVTLRASRSEFSDEDDGKQTDGEDMEEEDEQTSRDSVALAFVPASLRSPHPVIPEVEETMEELDILAHMPDVLGISQDALCPDASYDGAHNEAAEPCEHQLDLLVDVIDFLSSEHTEVSEDESYNEAAQTLLTIGNLAHLSQSTIQAHLTDAASPVAEEVGPNREEETAPGATLLASGHESAETSTETIVAPQTSAADSDNGDAPAVKSGDQVAISAPLKSSSPQPKKGRSTKVKPKPNLGRASRPAQPESRRTDEDVNTEAANRQITDSVSAPEPAPTPTMPEPCPPSSADHFSPSEEPTLRPETAASPTPESFTEVRLESSAASEPSNEDLASPVADPSKSDPSGAETQAERGSSADSVPLQEPVDPRARSQLQKIKPKPNLAQTARAARSKPQTEQDSPGKDVEPEPELEPEAADVERVDAATSDQTSSDTFNLSDDLFEPSNRETAPTLERSGGPAPTETTDRPASRDSPAAQKEEDGEAASTGGAKRGRLQKIKPKPNLARSRPQTKQDSPEKDVDPAAIVSDKAKVEFEACPSFDSGCTLAGTEEPDGEEAPLDQTASENPNPTASESKSTGTSGEESEAASTGEAKRARSPKVEPEPSPAPAKPGTASDPVTEEPCGSTESPVAEVETQQICATALPAKPSQSTGAASVSAPPLEISTKPTRESTSAVELHKTDVGVNSSEPNAPQWRRRFSKLQPNLGSPTRAAHTKPQPKSIGKPEEDRSPSRPRTRSPLNAELGSAESEKTPDGGSDAPAASGPVASALTDSVPGNNGGEKSTDGSESRGDKASDNEEAGPSFPGVDPDAESKINPSLSAGKSPEGLETSETTQTPANNGKSQSAQSSDDAPPELPDSSRSSNKAPQPRRGRLIKPKPNLGRGARPPQPPPVQSSARAEAAATAAPLPPEPSPSSVSAPEPATRQPEGPSPEDPAAPASPLGRLTQMIVEMSQDGGSSASCLTQTTSTPSGEGTQNHPSLTIFPDMLPEQVPSDPDEPFFILSLTEIPVCSSGDAAGLVPYLPPPDASTQEQRFVSDASAGDGGETGLISGPDPADPESPLTENPEHPHGPPPQTEENNSEAEVPRAKRGASPPGGRAKAQVKPDGGRRKRVTEAAAAETQDGSDDRLNVGKETSAPEDDDDDDDDSGAQTNDRKTKGGDTGRRKPKDPPPPSRPDASSAATSADAPHPPATSAAGGSEVKPAHTTTRKHSAPTPPSPHSPTEESGSEPRPSTSQSAAEVLTPPPMDCVDEEPTNVSQYFLSDIFTEVEEE